MDNETKTDVTDRSRPRVVLFSIVGGITVIVILATAIAVAAMNNEDTATDVGLETSLSLIETPEAPTPQSRTSKRSSFFDSDPLEGLDCVREPLIMRTDDTSVGKLLNKDQIALITCAQ
jgi:hypothetical protein